MRALRISTVIAPAVAAMVLAVPAAAQEPTPEDADRMAALKAAVRSVVTAQDLHRASHGRYAATLEEVIGGVTDGRGNPLRFPETVRVHFPEAGAGGFVLIARDEGAPEATCVFFSGEVERVPETPRGKRTPPEKTILCDATDRVERAYMRLRGALRSALTAQDAHYQATKSFTGNLADLESYRVFRVPPGVELVIAEAGPRGVALQATHPDLPGRSCVQWYGRAGELAPLHTLLQRKAGHESPGRVVCDDPPGS